MATDRAKQSGGSSFDRPKVVKLTKRYVNELIERGVSVETIATSFGVGKNAVYNWSSSESNSLPEKHHFVRLYGLAKTPTSLLAVVLLGIRYGTDSNFRAPVFNLALTSGMILNNGFLTPTAASILGIGAATGFARTAMTAGAFLGPIGWLAAMGAGAVVGQKLFEKAKREEVQTSLSSEAVEALSIDPTKSWADILEKIEDYKKRGV